MLEHECLWGREWDLTKEHVAEEEEGAGGGGRRKKRRGKRRKRRRGSHISWW